MSGLSSVIKSQLRESELLKKKSKLLEEQRISFQNIKNKSFNLLIKGLENSDLLNVDKDKLINSLKLLQKICNDKNAEFIEFRNVVKNLLKEKEDQW